MFKQLFLLGVLCFILSTSQGLENKQITQIEEEDEQLLKLIVKVDNKVNKLYQHYLGIDPKIEYQANINLPFKLLLFFVYRGPVGTFLAIVQYSKIFESIDIQTFVKLGEGRTQSSVPISATKINPFIITIKIEEGQFVVELDEDGNFLVDGQTLAEGDQSEGPFQTNSDEIGDAETLVTLDPNDFSQAAVRIRRAKINQFLLENYWNFLRDGLLLNEQVLMTNERTYFMLTYTNIVGTFLAIVSINQNGQIILNNLVKLAEGVRTSDPVENLDPIPFFIEIQEVNP